MAVRILFPSGYSVRMLYRKPLRNFPWFGVSTLLKYSRLYSGNHRIHLMTFLGIGFFVFALRPTFLHPAVDPAQPTPHGIPDAFHLRTLLIKPVYVRCHSLHRLFRNSGR